MILKDDNSESFFVEVDYHQGYKYKQSVNGDVFLQHKVKEDNRIITVLSDGLGSGIKANVLATLTSSMAVNFISNSRDITKTAEVIMKTLPVCKVRKISYSTFTIIDIDNNGFVKIIEYDNPSFILIRDNRVVDIPKKLMKLNYNKNKENTLYYSEFTASLGDRIVFFSDGVSQSGMGAETSPLGWGQENVKEFALKYIKQNSEISARELAKSITNKAFFNDGYKPKDDITCGVIYFRRPRKTIVVTGPPVSKEKDTDIAKLLQKFNGKKIICGGTTAKIIARELDRKVVVSIKDHDPDIPPVSEMEGIDLITEGTITIGKILELLEQDNYNEYTRNNAVTKVINLLLDSDIIYFVVGTKINDAHQDPNIPIELGIRRNLIKNIVKQLEEKHLKETKLQFM